MPTKPDPFAPPGTPGPEQLAAYVQGRLSADEQHLVERAMEADPLLREAVEGLQEPGAVAAMGELNKVRPFRAGGPWAPWVVGLVVVVVVAVVFWPTASPGPVPVVHSPADPVQVRQTDPGTSPIGQTELAVATEIPAAEQIGRPPSARPSNTTDETPVARSTDVEPMVDRHTDPSTLVRPAAPRPMRGTPRASVQLLYLHDLKLVHPKELYEKDLLLPVQPGGVDASHADRRSQQQQRGAVRNLPYTAFLEGALAQFAAGDDRGCLEELNFLLTQYPDDLNALFYAGLCTYNLGLYTHARNFLHRAATHPIDVFREEATWYHALTLDQLGDHTAAREAYERIASQGGFYARSAAEKIGTP